MTTSKKRGGWATIIRSPWGRVCGWGMWRWLMATDSSFSEWWVGRHPGLVRLNFSVPAWDADQQGFALEDGTIGCHNSRFLLRRSGGSPTCAGIRKSDVLLVSLGVLSFPIGAVTMRSDRAIGVLLGGIVIVFLANLWAAIIQEFRQPDFAFLRSAPTVRGVSGLFRHPAIILRECWSWLCRCSWWFPGGGAAPGHLCSSPRHRHGIWCSTRSLAVLRWRPWRLVCPHV